DIHGSASSTASGPSATLLSKLQSTATAVWLDSVESLSGGTVNQGRMGLADHLRGAVAQAAQAKLPGVALFVVYNLPNRDCGAGASAGKLLGSAGLDTYKHQYIDIIAQTVSSAAYKDLRVVFIVEPDSLPNMVTNAAVPACATVKSQGLYVDGVTYAVSTLGALPNVTLYLDIAQSAWLGWPSNMMEAVPLYLQVLKGAAAGAAAVRGFVTNVSNYIPLQEPYLSAADTTTLGDTFYSSNPCFDELSYVKALSAQFSAAGLPNMHFLTDTSRNGWAPIHDGKPIDRRPLRSDWCNVKDAGLGERPQASPALWSGYDAFVWVKPPGESDGPSLAGSSCDPANAQLDTMAEAPAAGAWFTAGLSSMAQNATPAL
ncbi:MAG: hypothetical protein EOO40_05300, partial [Deltaproteobacteria bacterium]